MKLIRSLLLIFVLCWLCVVSSKAQLKSSGGSTVTYEELYDDPYDIRKLFIMFQPVYGELFVTNINVGFGLEAQYYHLNKFDFRAHFRKAYSQKFDLERDVAENNQDLQNVPKNFSFLEFGGTYHIADKEETQETKMILYSDRYKGRKWASKVPDYIKIPSKVRKIYGGRLGFFSFQSSTDLKRATDKQGVTLVDENQLALDSTISVFSNVRSTGFYLGGSLAILKNFAVRPEKTYNDLVSDLIFTVYLDILIAPSVAVDDVVYNNNVYSSDVLNTNTLGIRGGLEGKFNRKLGWAYNAEMGFRPSLTNRGFYLLVKISIPVLATDLKYSKEAFGK